jgi:hypothetical protein
MKKISPELREQIRITNEEGRRARAQMQAAIDRVEARMRADEERRERRRRLIRRVFLLDRAA